MIDGVSLLERLYSLGFTHDATLEHMYAAALCVTVYKLVYVYTGLSKCKHFEIEGIAPCLAIGVTTMCKELLRMKRGKKVDFMFITGFPSLRPTFSAEHKAAFLLLFQETGYDQIPVSLKKMGVLYLMQGLFPLPNLLQYFDPKVLFLTAFENKIDVKVLQQYAKQNPEPLCTIFPAFLPPLCIACILNSRIPLSRESPPPKATQSPPPFPPAPHNRQLPQRSYRAKWTWFMQEILVSWT